MITQEQIPLVINHPLYATDGDKIGDVKHVFLDDATGQPEWLCVKTGLFGLNETFVPIRDASLVQDHVEVPYDKATIKDAPNVDVDSRGHLSAEEERELYRYYNIDWESSWQQANQPGETGWAHAGGLQERERLGRSTDDAMTRSEEQLHVGSESHPTGKARLRKYIVTEEQQITVPTSHERARIEREPVTAANVDEALSGPELSEDEHEITLYEERPVVAKETVPVERVRLTKEQIADEEAISEQVRKERIEAEGDIDETDRGRGSGRGSL
ncbi:photosystem reaction center subunit H [Planobispora rosea]|uniref:Photosystem reaction center subunit H n=1 Tax=Planobispora rosea TaxID=35762 RepID=A0A8J3S0B6_PLARO|nr:PRC and DUF2382 domain-containing protein [Planobispora rosea]GGS63512.1 photosystem reaction center subunit H [Planobispora rosea]GIH84479.1 photosystem reaction center subunit H [Planobispora rosea]